MRLLLSYVLSDLWDVVIDWASLDAEIAWELLSSKLWLLSDWTWLEVITGVFPVIVSSCDRIDTLPINYMNPAIIVSNFVCGKCHIRLLTRRLASNSMVICILVMYKRITSFLCSATSPWVHSATETALAPKMLGSPSCGIFSEIRAFFDENRPISNLASVLNYCDLIISQIILCAIKPGPRSRDRLLHFPGRYCVFM